jgi:hypothetical protein
MFKLTIFGFDNEKVVNKLFETFKFVIAVFNEILVNRLKEQSTVVKFVNG